MSFRNSVLHRIQIDEQLVTTVEDQDTPIALADISSGIVFVWATWSGVAQLAIKGLGKALSATPNLGNIRIYVVDGDTENGQQLISSLGETPSGAGETYWVSGGVVVNKLSTYTEEQDDILLDYTNALASHP